MDYFFLWAFPALIVGVLGVVLWLSACAHIKRCRQISGWQKTSGIVEYAEVIARSTRRYQQSTRTSYRSIRYEPCITYAYTVGGNAYKGNRYANFNGEYSAASHNQAAEIVAGYPTGSTVEVTYNPENPAQAYLRPATNTTRLEKQRNTYLIVILIAAAWFAVGTFIRFSSLAAGQKAFEDLKTGAAVLPVNADQMAPKLELLANQYGLTCAKESWAGTTLVYERELCSPANAALHPSVEVYSRRDDPQKIDLVSAIQTLADEESAADYFLAVAELALTEDSSANAATWLRASLQEVIESGASATTTVGGVRLTLDSLGETIRFNLGDIQ